MLSIFHPLVLNIYSAYIYKASLLLNPHIKYSGSWCILHTTRSVQGVHPNVPSSCHGQRGGDGVDLGGALDKVFEDHIHSSPHYMGT